MHTQTSRIYKGMDMNDVKRIHPHGHIPERFGEMNGRGGRFSFSGRRNRDRDHRRIFGTANNDEGVT